MITHIELREQNQDWFEIKSWIKKEDGTIFNFTEESHINTLDEARKLSAEYIRRNIIEGCEEITFYHSK